jgi:transcriptional regulator with GAF, ATPase, and Fis domain
MMNKQRIFLLAEIPQGLMQRIILNEVHRVLRSKWMVSDDYIYIKRWKILGKMAEVTQHTPALAIIFKSESDVNSKLFPDPFPPLLAALTESSWFDGRAGIVVADETKFTIGSRTQDAPAPNTTWVNDTCAFVDFPTIVAHTPISNLMPYVRAMEAAAQECSHNLIKREAEIAKKYQGPIVGQSKAINDVRALIQRFAPTETTLLIQGESGTGKELVAREIHAHSLRSKMAYVAVNCAAIPKDMVESELFGHVKGAYTGATGERTGKFELAHKGTLFLDEVGDLPHETQSKLLRALQQKEIEKVGGSTLIPVDVRVIAATNKDLRTEVKEGRFRDDLFFRLNDFIISIPPLRDRSSDIRLLIEYFLRKNLEANQPPRSFTSDAMKMLLGYNWPGNVRSLEKVVNASCILSDSEAVDAHIVAAAMSSQPQSGQSIDGASRTLASVVERVEKEHIQSVLNECEWVKERAIEILGTTRKTLNDKIEKYGLQDPSRS